MKEILNRVRRSKFWYYFLFIVFLPLYSFIWKNIINFPARILYFIWVLVESHKTHRKTYDLKKENFLIVRNEKEFRTIANKIKKNITKKKIKEILSKKKKFYKYRNLESDLKNFKFNINDLLTDSNKIMIMKLLSSKRILSAVSNYLGVFPTISNISLHINTPVKGSKERGSMLWHKDDFGFKSIDMFMTIGKLNELNGPFFFVKKNKLGPLSKIEQIVKPRKGERNKIDSKIFNKVYNKKVVYNFIGKSGDAIFIDSINNYHKGGFCKKKNRIMLRATFQTNDNIRKSNLHTEFIKNLNIDNFKKNIFIKYVFCGKRSFFYDLLKLDFFLIKLYRFLHFKVSVR